MVMHNTEIAAQFEKVADLLEIEGANPFRIRAYRNAALTISSLNKEVSELLAEGVDLCQFPGIGKDLAEKITLLVKTSQFPLLKEIEHRIPAVLSQLMQIEGLGPKRVQLLYKKLKIKTFDDLQKAIVKGRVRELYGFGEKTEQKILQSLGRQTEYAKRIPLAKVLPIARSLIQYMKTCSFLKQIEFAGSLRRHKETVGDLDLLATAEENEKVIAHFVKFNEVAEIVSQGPTRSTVKLKQGLQVDLRVVPLKSFGAALVYFTGSKAHNIAIRKLALQKKLKLNEYGVFKGQKYLAGKTETEVYAKVGLPYIEPELRENNGEIAAAKKNKLPTLITLKDIRGDLHCHTKATDGTACLLDMVNAAIKQGYEYLAITDHSKHLAMTHGFDKKALWRQIKLIDKLNEKLAPFVILKSIEVDILIDGKLDLPNDILKELDLTVCAIHSNFNLPTKKQTLRLLRAMDNPYFTILAHPTGRLINQREAYSFALFEIMEAAKERDCILELNAQPTRLDLDDKQCKLAKEIGVKIAINTDAHNVNHFDYMMYGIFQARRGWLEKTDVINTYQLKELRKLVKR